jgi:hypothetical protein
MIHVIGRLLAFYTSSVDHFILGVTINIIQIITIITAIEGREQLGTEASILIAIIGTLFQVLYNIRNYKLADKMIKDFQEKYNQKYNIEFYNIDFNKAWEKEQD